MPTRDEVATGEVVSRLKQKAISNKIAAGTRVEVPFDTTKFVCKNHQIVTIITMNTSIYRTEGRPTIDEVECSCGVTYFKMAPAKN